MSRKLTKEEVISRFREKHGDKYDYSKITDINYVNTSTHVPIICRKHGAWMQTPHDHINGAGCPLCWEERRGIAIRVTLNEFKDRARETHGIKYGYEFVKFDTTKDKVDIVCKKHGIFKQCVQAHLSGYGCPQCREENRGKSRIGKPLKGARKTLFGVAKLDIDFSSTSDKIVNKAYRHWRNMLQRCYDEKCRYKYKSYVDCKVCDEWLNFSAFLEWFLITENSTKERYHLDKDILCKNNKIYSPDNCCFVPSVINCLLTNRKSCRGAFPIGVVKSTKSKMYETSLSTHKHVYIGSFLTHEDAFCAYKKSKEKWIKEQATKYYNDGKIAKNVYDALMKYEVEITD